MHSELVVQDRLVAVFSSFTLINGGGDVISMILLVLIKVLIQSLFYSSSPALTVDLCSFNRNELWRKKVMETTVCKI